MLITKLKLKNWRNFRGLEIPLHHRTYIIGSNASGKSNLLDVFRFLRDICKPAGGGLQKAIEDRGGIKKLRCLQARSDIEIKIDIEISEEPGGPPIWEYSLGFKPEGTGAQRLFVTQEIAKFNGVTVLNRPDRFDKKDTVRLTQTALEQINANKDFREIADFFGSTTYLHLVPQLLKFSEMSGRILEDDPFGQGLLQRIAKTPSRSRDAKLRRIQAALEKAVPQFSELKFELDKVNGQPHLMASYQHWRNYGAWQREDQFSDGTLRLIGLLWMLQENNTLLLLEEPELSLNDAIVAHIPLMIDRILRKQKALSRQVIITTHSEALLRNPLEGNSILLLEAGADGTTARIANNFELELMNAGMTPAEVMLPKARPSNIDQLGLL
ncbi:ATP-binding protein [Pseudomonas sp. PS01301]|uniref:AAA family ATPase n=1 Tax=Pseudomonas sp. PS01301 TaxID=2991437 RepID=UPI00249CA7A0|nr:ATP-binding protein [Pseudomonas sp. PS01301]